MPVIRLDELELDSIVAHEGIGEIEFARLSERFAMPGDWDFVDFARVPPGCTVGAHAHGDDEELYVVLRGTGVVSVDGRDERIEARDILMNPPFSVHGVRNDGSEPLEFVVLRVPTRASRNGG
jgi:mannose-6-phosphate isomerase-like protein (cupin superfamily)